MCVLLVCCIVFFLLITVPKKPYIKRFQTQRKPTQRIKETLLCTKTPQRRKHADRKQPTLFYKKWNCSRTAFYRLDNRSVFCIQKKKRILRGDRSKTCVKFG